MSKPDVSATLAGAAGATWLGIGDLNAWLALGVAGLTILLLLVRLALAIREWRAGRSV